MPVEPDQRQIEAMIPIVYARLRTLAQRYVRQHPSDTLRPTALVHEAWLKLQGAGDFESREHFSAVAAKAMRQILVDRARHRGRLKRGGDAVRTTLSAVTEEGPDVDIVDLNRALEALEREDPRGASVVELRYFGGLTTPEIARVLGLSPRTVQTSWRLSRAWLVDRLARGEPTR